VAFFHTLAAFLMLAFLIVHVYLTTTGHSPLAHIKAMITGWEDQH
jgi:thiosulfate reductase cytochrome b subunit